MAEADRAVTYRKLAAELQSWALAILEMESRGVGDHITCDACHEANLPGLSPEIARPRFCTSAPLCRRRTAAAAALG